MYEGKTIYKYELCLTITQALRLPVGSKVISIQFIDNISYAWVMVDPLELTREEVVIKCFGTGNMLSEMSSDFVYLCTLKWGQSEAFIWHFFINKKHKI